MAVSSRTGLLHLGMHKTGTTALQHSLRDYRDDRWVMADFGGVPNHSAALLAQVLSPESPPAVFGRLGLSPEQADVQRAAWSGHLDRFLRATSQDVIFSGEGLTSARMGPAEIAALLGWLRQWFDRIEAVAYVRPPAALAASLFQQRVKGGQDRFELPEIAYRARLLPWIEALGADRVALVRFERATLKGGDVVTDFAARLGLDQNRITPVDRNVSLSGGAVALLYLWNREGWRLPPGPNFLRQRRNLVTRLGRIGGPPLRFAPDLMVRWMAEGQDDLAWLAERLGPVPEADPAGQTGTEIAGEADLLDLALAQAPALQALAGTPAPARNLAALARQVARLAPHAVLSRRSEDPGDSG